MRQAIELGFGARLDEGGSPRPAFRAGLSWGRGFESRFGTGWLAIDGSVTTYGSLGDYPSSTEDGGDGPALKLDTTLGVRPTGNSAATLQVFWSRSGGDGAALRVVPSYGRRIRGSTFGQVGVVLGAGGAPSLGLKVGISTEF